MRDETVMTRARAYLPLLLRIEGQPFKLVVELLSPCRFLPTHVPLAAFSTARDN